jgi:spore coat protein CotF
MKIKLTESQYLKVITENQNPNIDRLLQKFFDDTRSLDEDEKLYYFFDILYKK